MRGILKAGTALVLAAGLAGCGDEPGPADIGTVLGGKSSAQREREAAEAQRRANKVPIESVAGIEIGRTSNGLLLTAYGVAPGMGYSLPALRVRREGQPGPDGFIEFDFVASEPIPGIDYPATDPRARQVRADLPISLRALQNARGIRVWALQNQRDITFGRRDEG